MCLPLSQSPSKTGFFGGIEIRKSSPIIHNQSVETRNTHEHKKFSHFRGGIELSQSNSHDSSDAKRPQFGSGRCKASRDPHCQAYFSSAGNASTVNKSHQNLPTGCWQQHQIIWQNAARVTWMKKPSQIFSGGPSGQPNMATEHADLREGNSTCKSAALPACLSGRCCSCFVLGLYLFLLLLLRVFASSESRSPPLPSLASAKLK